MESRLAACLITHAKSMQGAQWVSSLPFHEFTQPIDKEEYKTAQIVDN